MRNWIQGQPIVVDEHGILQGKSRGYVSVAEVSVRIEALPSKMVISKGGHFETTLCICARVVAGGVGVSVDQRIVRQLMKDRRLGGDFNEVANLVGTRECHVIVV